MKYEFHVGDYVETKTGTIGYVSEVAEKGCPFWTATKLSDFDIDDNRYTVDASYCIFSFGRFNRIGQYDFTKKDKNKIEPLCEEYIKSFPICKTTTTGNDSEWRSIDIGALGKKINELVETVNRLEEKVNEMA